MMRTLLTTTAVALLLSSPVLAQNNNADPAAQQPAGTTQMQLDPQLQEMLARGYQVADTDNLASRIIGQPVYSGPGTDADNIGDINDIVLTQDGQIGAVVIGVGGFLGVGERDIAVDFKQLQWTVAADNTERWVLPVDRDTLSAAAEFQWREDEPADTAAANPNANQPAQPGAADTAAVNPNANQPAQPAQPAPADTAAANQNADQNAADGNQAAQPTDVAANNPNANQQVTQGMEGATDTAANPNQATPGAIDPNTLQPLEAGTLTADDLDDIDVIGADNTQIAEVSDLVLTPEGQIDALLIDFGGFLGIGQKTVAVGMDNLQFVQDQGGNRFVRINATREQLDAAPAYDEASYAANRDAMRMVVTQ